MPSNPVDAGTGSPRFARPDFERWRRKGVPEVILADRKTVDDSLAIARQFLEAEGRALLSRVPEALEARLRQEFAEADLEWYSRARAAALHRAGYQRPDTGGRVGILTAGTSDIPRAEEAALVCREMGCRVATVYDVGVAGLHRLFDPLERLLSEDQVDVLIVAAGMDGALPSVVAGLVPVPVIGLPPSVGYGLGGGGVTALLSMLQTCAPGLTAVNIDNGIGAGATAGLIANRVGMARKQGN
jgi:pyridinium-3,5-biscarboxylic acid mononucleotide synthase